MQVPVELKRKYLERRIEDIQVLLSSLEDNDFAPALKLGHQVKGNALTFDFPQMAPIGIEIELAAKNHDKVSVQLLSQRMVSEIQIARQLFH
jgi:HPt (histidine-containing phosphotransfer) domain-containing protein